MSRRLGEAVEETLGIRRRIGYGNGGSTSTTRRLLRRGSRWTRRKGRGPMIRKVVCIGALVAASTNLVVVLSSAGVAGAVPPPATGTAICKIASGSGTLSPGLTAAGTPGGVKIQFVATMVVGGSCGGAVTSPSGVTVNGGTVKGHGFYNPVPSTANGSSCANFAGSDIVGKIVVKVNWSVTGPGDRPHQGGLQEQHRYRRGVGHGHRHPQRSERDCGQVRFVHHPEQPAQARSRDQYSGANVLWDHFDLLHTSWKQHLDVVEASQRCVASEPVQFDTSVRCFSSKGNQR